MRTEKIDCKCEKGKRGEKERAKDRMENVGKKEEGNNKGGIE